MVKQILVFILLIFSVNNIDAAIAVQNGLTHQYKVEGGKVYRGKITIQNIDTLSANVKLYLQDVSYNYSGITNYTNPSGSNKNSNAAWVKLSTNFLKLAKKEKTDVPFEIFVPDSVSEVGSYWSVIMVEPVEDIQPNNNKQSGVNITSLVRYAVQVITDYHTENINPKLKFESIDILKNGTSKVLRIAIANQGKVYCSPATTVELYNKKTGEKAGTFNALSVSLLPENSKSIHINLGAIPLGKYKVMIITNDENENSFAVETEVTIVND